MKRFILASLLVVMGAASSFAADSPVDFSKAGLNVVANATAGAQIGRLSASNGLGWGMTESGYTLITQHVQGTRAFGTSHDGTAIFWAPVPTKGTAHPTAAPTVGVTYFNTGWTVM